MLSNKKSTALSIADSINVVAALIGIFGFLTGISSVPVLLSGKNGAQADAGWVFGGISYSVSIPVFIIALVFVYGLYFVVVFRASKWLFSQGIIKRWRRPGIRIQQTAEYREMYGDRPGDALSLLVFISLGSAIGWLVVRAFLGASLETILAIPTTAANIDAVFTMLAIVGTFLFNVWLCLAAKDSASIE